MTQIELIQGIYDFCYITLYPAINLLIGIMQFIMAIFAIVVIYKLFKLFF